MSEDLESCPKCNIGKLRPTDTVSVDEFGVMRQLKCDNPDCNFAKYRASIN
jgi:hypothetical protein